jgi:hypothetical protein
MHNRILRNILPYYGIVFLPQTIPVSLQNVDAGMSQNRELPFRAVSHWQRMSEMRGRDCLRYPSESPGGKVMREAFLGGLVKVLDRQT